MPSLHFRDSGALVCWLQHCRSIEHDLKATQNFCEVLGLLYCGSRHGASCLDCVDHARGESVRKSRLEGDCAGSDDASCVKPLRMLCVVLVGMLGGVFVYECSQGSLNHQATLGDPQSICGNDYQQKPIRHPLDQKMLCKS